MDSEPAAQPPETQPSAGPWALKTPPLTSDFTMERSQRDGRDVLVCTVGKTVLLYDARFLADLKAMLITHGDWMELGSADEQKEARPGTVEAWARSPDNPVGGWYGLKKGLRGRSTIPGATGCGRPEGSGQWPAELTRPSGPTIQPAAAAPEREAARSARMSASSSRPTESRTSPSEMPWAWRSSGL